MRPKVDKYAVMLGFLKTDIDTVKYLKIGDGGYEFVDDWTQATRFYYKNHKKVKGFATPEKWLRFFEDEEYLKDWVFHIVKKQHKHVNV